MRAIRANAVAWRCVSCLALRSRRRADVIEDEEGTCLRVCEQLVVAVVVVVVRSGGGVVDCRRHNGLEGRCCSCGVIVMVVAGD